MKKRDVSWFRFYWFWPSRHKIKEKLVMKVAYMLPKYLVYWCVIRVLVYATTGKYQKQVVPELTMADALTRWRQGMLGSEIIAIEK